MQKVFINKDTNIVEQILKVNTENELSDNYFSNCYAVIDKEDNINAYNLKYNKETEKFEVVEGLSPKDDVEIIKQPTAEDYNNLKQENEELKNRLDELENLITRSISEVK